ncbi:di-trans,poly-cis-decaprenylcistransferase [Paraphotobacterium marinum]|uniref:Ditrans,polycis-undecaprenyl-diphosphate synthase ((2E,6E)-farnesyl-diphosphate specific) n=1 Tax=Paraphotobacterium marinum TaxID=1755811 RepID=A0A220VC01_9GAMM|nr:isoprenyl transferase [Paraphotobacterium marinum]ASK77820.1 di-trans,poly-cis-decaprenylcistransferase [Paraphotobacterium marinum]
MDQIISKEKAPLPNHVAIIMDGNGRWAKQKGLPRHKGHRKGVETTKRIIDFSAKNKIKVLTLFAFSSENWKRNKREVRFLMMLFFITLKKDLSELYDRGVRLRVIGDKVQLPLRLQRLIELAEKKTANNDKLFLNIALNYGGQWDIVNATKAIVEQIETKQISKDEINTEYFSKFLQLSDLPNVDMLIRTSGEFRISNFLLWQIAYSELYFSEALWPDFSESHYQEALFQYQCRNRRFGA